MITDNKERTEFEWFNQTTSTILAQTVSKASNFYIACVKRTNRGKQHKFHMLIHLYHRLFPHIYHLKYSSKKVNIIWNEHTFHALCKLIYLPATNKRCSKFYWIMSILLSMLSLLEFYHLCYMRFLFCWVNLGVRLAKSLRFKCECCTFAHGCATRVAGLVQKHPPMAPNFYVPMPHPSSQQGPKGHRFDPHQRYCVVVLEQDTFILA